MVYGFMDYERLSCCFFFGCLFSLSGRSPYSSLMAFRALFKGGARAGCLSGFSIYFLQCLAWLHVQYWLARGLF